MLSTKVSDLQILIDFLRVPTPEAWLKAATQNLPLLLIDHAHCERKAAATAINFISKYPEKEELVAVMSPLAREELLHFEKVIDLMKQRQIDFGPLQPSNYAQKMHQYVTKGGCKERLRDQLIVGAIIEARSCERFHSLLSVLRDSQLEKFYASLVKSESRHFQDYLRLAILYGGEIEERIDFFLQVENKLIGSEDKVFRFHSGIPFQS
ncbi:tRNA-(ms[2]io[6]A)-hydroxylase [Legionella jamestowniensis]|uniref:tRNA hydroxylase n=1 Tax=Legionella jamestowniensis TaxID=455 RepID=A0A0W0UJT8_9GAMM|nr:tRNA-(ms[2]io[6]A)-hydroxylase [Legionella jamestowniensis]KTD08177.1 tRNA hydroxylase [Legionella jamestowniensis]OCH98502.1 tRNA hydroxylase [Legionella jamestowniensis]SFL98904.1 tRNA-(ms[2]io[6]A)-hydroxylase [Legionella jamestowniensis DSM 19215]